MEFHTSDPAGGLPSARAALAAKKLPRAGSDLMIALDIDGTILGHDGSLAHEPWPAWDDAYLQEDELEIPVQVNGKVRGRIRVPAAAAEAAVVAAALACPEVAPFIAGKAIKKQIYVPKRMVNLVVAG